MGAMHSASESSAVPALLSASHPIPGHPRGSQGTQGLAPARLTQAQCLTSTLTLLAPHRHLSSSINLTANGSPSAGFPAVLRAAQDTRLQKTARSFGSLGVLRTDMSECPSAQSLQGTDGRIIIIVTVMMLSDSIAPQELLEETRLSTNYNEAVITTP